MTRDLDNLYQDIILEHNNRPRNRRSMAGATVQAKGYNPVCGDEVEVYLKIANARIVEASFQGQGCAISQASASLLTEAVQGLTVDQARQLQVSIAGLLQADGVSIVEFKPAELAALSGVRKFPARHRCASLAWSALAQALQDAGGHTLPAASANAQRP